MSEIHVIKLPHATKVNLVAFTDVHLAARAPGRRKATYLDEILAKLHWSAELATKIKGAGVCGGDLYHVKSPRSESNPHSMNTQIIEAFQQFPQQQVYGILGNHDVTGDNMDTGPEQPIGALIQAGVYWNLGVQSVIFEAENGLRVRVDGFNYANGPDLLKQIQETGLGGHERAWDKRLAIVHGFNQPGKSGLMYDKDWAIGWDNLKGLDYDGYFWGHDHSRKGIQQAHGAYHVQLGSLARAAWAKDEIDRPVSVAVFSVSREEGLRVVEKEVPVRPLELAFHTADLAVEKVEKREDIQQFMIGLDKQVQAVDGDDPTEILMATTDDPAVIATIKDACELA